MSTESQVTAAPEQTAQTDADIATHQPGTITVNSDIKAALEAILNQQQPLERPYPAPAGSGEENRWVAISREEEGIKVSISYEYQRRVNETHVIFVASDGSLSKYYTHASDSNADLHMDASYATFLLKGVIAFFTSEEAK